jgi:hypothetical protein
VLVMGTMAGTLFYNLSPEDWSDKICLLFFACMFIALGNMVRSIAAASHRMTWCWFCIQKLRIQCESNSHSVDPLSGDDPGGVRAAWGVLQAARLEFPSYK